MKKLLPVLGIWLFIFAVWSVYRYFFKFSEGIDELLIKPTIFLTPVFIYLARNRSLNLINLGFKPQKIKSVLLWGFGFGLFITIEGLLIWFMKGKSVNSNFFMPLSLFTNIIISLSTSLTEEILYRGFITEKIILLWKNGWLANIITAFLFCATHISIGIWVLKYQGFDLGTYLLLMFILSLVNGLIYIKTRTVYASTISHFLWNFSNTLFL